MELKDRTAIVTGSGSGVGRAIALEFARQGANVVCCARRENLIRETLAQIESEGGRGLAVPTDITQRDQVENVAARTLERFDAIDVLYNNAGSFRCIGGIWEVDPDLWWGDATVNLLGTMLCCRVVLPHMMERDEGIVINMSGGGATRALPGGSGYGCSKAGVIRLTDGIAREMERVGSKVLAFTMGPGFVRTEMTELQIQTPEGQKWIPSSKEAVEVGRDRRPEDCARDSVELIRVACPELNGRGFGVGMDFDAVLKAALEEKAERKK